MNKDQIKGAAKEAAGKVQRQAGALMDSPKTEAKGAVRQVTGKVQKEIGNARQDLKDSMRQR